MNIMIYRTSFLLLVQLISDINMHSPSPPQDYHLVFKFTDIADDQEVLLIIRIKSEIVIGTDLSLQRH